MKQHTGTNTIGCWALAAMLLLFGPAQGHAQSSIAEEISQHCKGLPFTMPEIPVPSFPDHRVNIRDHGAIADGRTMNTRPFAAAIQACAQRGGGTVVVPPGTWLTGPIRIESNINLHLERGALIQFSSKVEDFPFIAGLDGKSKRYIITPPISAYRAKNIAITGEGIIDGAGEVWRYVKRNKMTESQWKRLVASGGVVSSDGKEWWPSKEAMEGEEYLKQFEKSGKAPTLDEYRSTREFLRPDLTQFVQCNGILLDGVTFQNSPKFHVRPIQSENVIIRNVKVFAPWYGQNTDGIDPASCRNVIIYNSTVDVGDDGICLKPGSIAGSQKPGPSCENIVVSDCVVYHAHGGFVIGSESFGGVNNISVRNCIFIGTDVGVRFKSLRGKGGLVENVFIEGIQMRDIGDEAILFDMYYGGGTPEGEVAKERDANRMGLANNLTPRFQNILFRNIVCNGAERALSITGLPEMPVKGITFENVSIVAMKGLTFTDVENIRLENCSIVSRAGPVLAMNQSRNVVVNGGVFSSPAEPFLTVSGEKTENIRFVGVDQAKRKNAIVVGANVRTDVVKVD